VTVWVEVHPRNLDSSVSVSWSSPWGTETLLHMTVPDLLGIPYVPSGIRLPEESWPFPFPNRYLEGGDWRVVVSKGSMDSIQVKARQPVSIGVSEADLYGHGLFGPGTYAGDRWSLTLHTGPWGRNWGRDLVSLAREVSERLRDFFRSLEGQVWNQIPEGDWYREQVAEIWRLVKAGEQDPALAWDQVPVPFSFRLRVFREKGRKWHLGFDPVLPCCQGQVFGERQDWNHILSLSHLQNVFGEEWVEERRAELPLLVGGGLGL